jgi:hypothetical protein
VFISELQSNSISFQEIGAFMKVDVHLIRKMALLFGHILFASYQLQPAVRNKSSSTGIRPALTASADEHFSFTSHGFNSWLQVMHWKQRMQLLFKCCWAIFVFLLISASFARFHTDQQYKEKLMICWPQLSVAMWRCTPNLWTVERMANQWSLKTQGSSSGWYSLPDV